MREIDRIIFSSLNYCPIDCAYFVLVDGYFHAKFYADSNADAIARFRAKNFG